MSEIHVFNHNAMTTPFQIRIAGHEKTYAAQSAQSAFALTDHLESHLSRFRASSSISRIARLAPGEKLRLNEPLLACLELAKKMELVTRGAFSISAAALQSQLSQPQWTLLKEEFCIRCESGKLEFDLGAIGKGFALDRMAEVLREWDCESFLLVAGGSSILAGEPPPENPAWSCGLGDDNSPVRYWLKNCSLSGSGLAVKGQHIIDPRTGKPAHRQNRTWALAKTAAESDALSTAFMVLDDTEVSGIIQNLSGTFAWLQDGNEWKEFGDRKLLGIDVA